MTSRDSRPDASAHILRGNEAVGHACDAARQFGEAQWLSDEETARLCVVVEELVTNLYEHGGLAESDEVQLQLASVPEGIQIVIADPGKPFDPWSATVSEARPARGGGAGIPIVRAWAHCVDYKRVGKANRLELLLPLS